jgi:pilus assembly protein Flp/PilA
MLQFDVLKTWMLARCKSERGASLVEYALLVALIAVVCIVAITFLGREASSNFSDIGDQVGG